MTKITDSRQRFGNRVHSYARYRPSYPVAVVSALLSGRAPSAPPVAADVGSGTGIFTRMLLAQGIRVFGVEPNAQMRAAAESELAAYQNFVSIDGSAEQTGLPSAAVDLVTAAQAFHWFDSEATLAEFRRILRPGGRLALVWNKRKLSQPFQLAYDALLHAHAPEYPEVSHLHLEDDDIARFFRPGEMQLLHFENSQKLDFDGLVGRLKSASYCPDEDSEDFARLVGQLRGLHGEFAEQGLVRFEYDTRLYLGAIAD